MIADEFVDPSFGSGALKITPAHDVNDYSIGLRHGLPAVTVIAKDGSLNEKVRGEGQWNSTCISIYVYAEMEFSWVE